MLQLQNTSLMSDKECDRLHQISTKLASGLNELVNNKIAENLRSLNNEISSKLQNYNTFMKESLSQVSNELVNEHDRLTNEIENLKTINQSCRENQNNIQQNRKTFEKVLIFIYIK